MILHDSDKYDFRYLLSHQSELITKFPMLQVEEIGQSVLGRSILALKIGEGDRKIHVNASFHANEWITSALLMKFLEDYLHAYVEGECLYDYHIPTLFQRNTLWIIPMVNPDGVDLVLQGIESVQDQGRIDQLLQWNDHSEDFNQWKANIRGVDLNDQFPAYWETECERRLVEGPSSRDFGGEAPLTEPEAQALAAFTIKQDFDLVMALHTQGEEIYWNYRDLEPSNAEAIAERLATVSGYEAIKLTGSDAGYKDWFIQELRRPGFTIELGNGVNPLPITDFSAIYPKMARILLEGLSL